MDQGNSIRAKKNYNSFFIVFGMLLFELSQIYMNNCIDRYFNSKRKIEKKKKKKIINIDN